MPADAALTTAMAKVLQRLDSYGLSRETGFVPGEPSRRLDSYYNIWEDLAVNIPQLLKMEIFLDKIRALPVLSVNKLIDESDWQRAYVLLAFLVHGVIHGCKQKVVPAALSVAFIEVCEHLGMEPVINYAGLCLFNWYDEGKTDTLSGLRSVCTFTGTIDEEAFYLVPVLVDRAGGRLPAQLLEAQVAAQKGDWQRVATYLETCSSTIRVMTDALKELSLCKPQTFYHDIRPYIAGIDVEFERPHDKPVHVKLAGGSAVQDPLFQFLDHMLGVKHQKELLREMRAYMLGRHRRSLEAVEELPSLQELANVERAGDDIQLKLEQCRLELKKWRDRHIAIVTRYILLPAQAAARKQDGEVSKVVGTAGSSPVMFLKDVRNDTILQHS